MINKYLSIFNFKIIISVAIIFIIVRIFVGYVITVPTDSMQPTLDNNSRYCVSKMYKEINRGDIVVFHRDGEIIDFVKRVIGLPGEHLELRDGKLYINSIAIEEPYIKYEGGIKDIDLFIPNNSYIVLGDNRSNSKDSRYWENPFLDEDSIKGKVIFIN